MVQCFSKTLPCVYMRLLIIIKTLGTFKTNLIRKRPHFNDPLITRLWPILLVAMVYQVSISGQPNPPFCRSLMYAHILPSYQMSSTFHRTSWFEITKSDGNMYVFQIVAL